MRIEFDQSVSLLEQRLRVASIKEPGRKHQKRKGAKALEKEKASAKRHNKLKTIKARKFKNAVAAYWRGDLDSYPEKRA